jgi:branched-chain amino acid transport system substrate-binding protein
VKLFALRIILLTLVLSSINASWGAEKAPLNVYVPGSYTGMMPFLATAIYESALAFAKKQNLNGGLNGRQINVIAQDDKNDITLAEKNAFIATADPNHFLTIGHPFSSMAIPIGKLYEKNKKLFATPYATNREIGQIGKFVKQLCFDDLLQATILANTATNELKANKILVLFNESDPYSSGLAKDFISQLNGTRTVKIKSYGYIFDHIDYKVLISSISDFQPNMIFLPELKVRAAEILKEILSSDFKAIPVLGSDGWGSEAGTIDIFFSGLNGESKPKILYTYHYHEAVKSPENLKLKAEFKSLKIEPYGPAVISYEFLKEIVNLSQKIKSVDNAKIAARMKNYTYKTSMGDVTFSAKGTKKNMVLLELTRTGLKLLKVVKAKE